MLNEMKHYFRFYNKYLDVIDKGKEKQKDKCFLF